MAQTGKTRIMLVDDSVETREYLRKLLQFESHLELVGMAVNGQEAVKVARETKPDLILMDINMPIMDGISAAEIIFREMPTIRVVMMSVQSEMAYLRRAMQVGAREFLIKPFTHDELLDILGEVGSLSPAPGAPAVDAAAPTVTGLPDRQAVVVAVFSPRGGAGCSTVALNLAISLHGQRKVKVLVMDGNLRFGALDAMLNLQITRSITDLLPSLGDNDPETLSVATLPHTSGIRLLAAPPSPEMADLLSVQNLKQIIKLGQQSYDYIVIDVGSHLNDKAINFMDMAHHIFVLLTPDIPAIKNARLFLEVAQGLDYEPEKISLVLNRADPSGGITAQDIERHLKQPIVISIPNSPRTTQLAINRGVPLVLYERKVDKNMPVTRQILALVELVPKPGAVTAKAAAAGEKVRALEKAAPTAPTSQPKRKGFLKKLFSRNK